MTDKNANMGLIRGQKVAIYIRVSTSYQVDKDSLPMQRKDLVAYSELILGIPDYEIFEDAGYSGKNTDRPAFQSMMARIKTGEFSHLLVWKIDRISRNLLDFSEMYSELKRLRVVFVSKNEQFDTSTAMGEAMLKIILVFAELERNMTAERVTATMISRATQGLWNGGHVPYGYDYDFTEGKFVIREDEAAVCRLIAEDYIKNKSLTHTSRLLNSKGIKTHLGYEWTTNSVWSIAQSKFYIGTYIYNRYKGVGHVDKKDPDEWVVVENHHPAIFTREQHETMLAIMEDNRRVMRTPEQHNRTKNVYVFGQICYCGKCGAKMKSTTGNLHKDGYRTMIYTCVRRANTSDCDNPSVNDLTIGEFVVNYIANIIRAKRSFSQIATPEELQDHLLRGQVFSQITAIEPSGLNELYNLMAKYKKDDSFKIFSKERRQKADTDPEWEALRNDKAKQERALKRLQDVFLYDDKPLPEAEYIAQRAEIISRLEDINRKLGMKQVPQDTALSDEDFIKKASHLLINSRLQGREYIYYKNLAVNTAPDILKEYVTSIIDNIRIADSRIVAITFKNGITHRFQYTKRQG